MPLIVNRYCSSNPVNPTSFLSGNAYKINTTYVVVQPDFYRFDTLTITNNLHVNSLNRSEKHDFSNEWVTLGNESFRVVRCEFLRHNSKTNSTLLQKDVVFPSDFKKCILVVFKTRRNITN